MNSMRSLLLPAEDHLTQMGSRFALRTHGASATPLSGAACFPREGDILLPPNKGFTTVAEHGTKSSHRHYSTILGRPARRATSMISISTVAPSRQAAAGGRGQQGQVAG